MSKSPSKKKKAPEPVRCAGCRQKVVQAVQKGELLPETAYSQIQAQVTQNGWEESPATVRALMKRREEEPYG